VGVGNAGGSGGTPEYAAGVVTGLDRSITASDAADGSSEQLTGLIETNAAIVAGYSGGPLVNQKGEVVGVNTAASATTRFSAASDAYAIPIAQALDIAEQIEAGDDSGTVHVGPTALLGVGLASEQNGYGVVVGNVLSGGPADDAGITAGDVITAIDGHRVTTYADVAAALLHRSPGTSVSVRYLGADGSSHRTSVTLTSGPPQ
jgi:S1-C subfamily serine protease